MPRLGDLRPEARTDDLRWPGKRDLGYEDPLAMTAQDAGRRIGSLFEGIPLLDELGNLIPAPILAFVLGLLEDVPVIGDIVEWILGEPGDENLLTAFFDGLRNFLPFLPDLGGGLQSLVSAAAEFIQLILNPAGAIQFLAAALIPGLDASIITSGAFADGLLPGVVSLVSNLWNGFTGLLGISPTQNDVGNAAAANTQTLATIASNVASIQAKLASDDPSVIVVEEDWEYTGAPNPARWQVIEYDGFDDGYAEVTGHELAWHPQGAHPRGWYLWYIGADAVATQDRFGVKIVLGQILTPNTTNPSYIDILLRGNAARTRFVRLRLGRTSFELAAINGGTKSVIGTQSFSQPGKGSIVDVEAGTNVGLRNFAITVNSTTYNLFDGSNVSYVGPDYRARGLGLYAGQAVDPPFGITRQDNTGSVAHWFSENNVAA